MVKGYCLKEKKIVEIKNPKYELNKLGRAIVRGECSSCAGKVYKILAQDEIPPELKAKMSKKTGSGPQRASSRHGGSRHGGSRHGGSHSRGSRRHGGSRHGGAKSRKSRGANKSKKSRSSRARK